MSKKRLNPAKKPIPAAVDESLQRSMFYAIGGIGLSLFADTMMKAQRKKAKRPKKAVAKKGAKRDAKP